MAHAERKARREQIVQERGQGASCHALASKYGLSLSSIQKACVGTSDPAYHKVNSFRVLYLALYRQLSYREIGQELGITKQRVEQILRRARQAGFNIPFHSECNPKNSET